MAKLLIFKKTKHKTTTAKEHKSKEIELSGMNIEALPNGLIAFKDLNEVLNLSFNKFKSFPNLTVR